MWRNPGFPAKILESSLLEFDFEHCFECICLREIEWAHSQVNTTYSLRLITTFLSIFGNLNFNYFRALKFISTWTISLFDFYLIFFTLNRMAPSAGQYSHSNWVITICLGTFDNLREIWLRWKRCKAGI